jgi:histidinol-phosphate aminotransferase
LCAVLAAHHGVAQERVVTGCGSDDVLDSAMRACCDAGSTIAMPVPTFSVVPAFAAMNELALRQIELLGDGSIDVDRLLSTGADLYYVCAPNNPTGSAASLASLRALLDGTSSVVLLDEAYVDYAEGDALGLLDAYPNLVVVRTLSKVYGVAGLRVGYALGEPSVIASITVSRGPYKVGGVAEAVAVKVLGEDTAWVASRVAEVRSLRAWLTGELRAAGLRVLDSEANFVAVLVDDAVALRDRLLQAGVLCRAYAGLPVFGDLIRVTIGPRSLLDEALAAIIKETR